MRYGNSSGGIYEVVVEAEDGKRPAGTLEIRDVFEASDRVCTDVP